MQEYQLNNGITMPAVGFGVYQITDADDCENAVLEAVRAGYRMIDTAQQYGNEEAVGKAVARCGVPREQLFITTKIWISNSGYEKAKKSITQSLDKLGLDFLDLMLVHQPFGDYYGTYRAMEEAYSEGKLRAIGVANFYPDRLVDLCSFAEITPQVNQVETHVFNQQVFPHEIMQKYHVLHESWGPFAEGRNNFFNHPVLKRIGEKHGKSVAQVALRYLLQRQVAVIPKSVHPERIRENFDLFRFSLDEEDMLEILGLDTKTSAFFSHYDPEIVEMMAEIQL
ncbi:MAG: aldo/keto reductase [Christensenella sp.]|nr:aldo/keto reductase [Christensenella sp.]